MWQTPKTNWIVSDFFNLDVDFNRIEQNLQFINDKYKDILPQITFFNSKTWTRQDIPQFSEVQRIYENVNALLSWCNHVGNNNLTPLTPMKTLLFDKLNELEQRIFDIFSTLKNAIGFPVALYDNTREIICDNKGQKIYVHNDIIDRIAYDSRHSSVNINNSVSLVNAGFREYVFNYHSVNFGEFQTKVDYNNRLCSKNVRATHIQPIIKFDTPQLIDGMLYTFAIDVCSNVALTWNGTSFYVNTNTKGSHTSKQITTDWQTIYFTTTYKTEANHLHLYPNITTAEQEFYTSNFRIYEGKVTF